MRKWEPKAHLWFLLLTESWCLKRRNWAVRQRARDWVPPRQITADLSHFTASAWASFILIELIVLLTKNITEPWEVKIWSISICPSGNHCDYVRYKCKLCKMSFLGEAKKLAESSRMKTMSWNLSPWKDFPFRWTHPVPACLLNHQILCSKIIPHHSLFCNLLYLL